MYVVDEDLYLVHHGIKGQKWGKRNGPPYPLGSDVSTGHRLKKPKYAAQAYDYDKEDLGRRHLTPTQKKVLAAIAVGAAVVGITYIGYKTNALEHLKFRNRENVIPEPSQEVLKHPIADIAKVMEPASTTEMAPFEDKLARCAPGLPVNTDYDVAAEYALMPHYEYLKKCSFSEWAAMRDYTGDYYYAWNSALRKNTPLTMFDHPQGIKHLTTLLDHCEIQKDMVLHRGTGNTAAHKLLGIDPVDLTTQSGRDAIKGMVFTDKGFSSTGIDVDSAWGGTQLHIIAPKGTKGLFVDPISSNPGEREVLLQRNTSFEVVDYCCGKSGNITDLIVRVVDQTT